MSINTAKAQVLPVAATLIESQYGCGPVHFAGTDEALYERHLLFDNVVDLERATARDRFEALAHSVRDILSQRWLLTEKTYELQNPNQRYLKFPRSTQLSDTTGRVTKDADDPG